MALPTFRSMAARRREREQGGAASAENHSDRTLTPEYKPGINIKRATKTRKTWVLLSCAFFFLSVIFLILTIIGNINSKPVIHSTYFFELDLANIIPTSAGTSLVIVNSLARSLGLHDFYRVGLWNFCEGYRNEGVTFCSTPTTLYWFNPVEILLSELLAGATIALPAEIVNILDLIKIASNVMFGAFLTGICMNFIAVFVAPLALYSRWWSLPLALWTFVAALLSAAAAVIATVMFTIFRNVITSQQGINIGASLGIQMFAFMWIGAAFSIFGFVVHLCLTCCCASRRDVRSGRRQGSKKAYDSGVLGEKKPAATGAAGAGAGAGRRWFGRKKEGEMV